MTDPYRFMDGPFRSSVKSASRLQGPEAAVLAFLLMSRK